MYAWLFDYFLTPSAFEIRIAGNLTVYRLNKRDILGAHIIQNWFSGGFWVGAFGNHPWNTVRLGNRLRRRYVLLEKRRWPRFLAISPDNPDEFVQLLGRSVARS